MLDRIVPFAMTMVRGDVERGPLLRGDVTLGGIHLGVEWRCDVEAAWGGRRPHQLHQHLMTDQGLAAPIPADRREHALRNLVPLTGAGRNMADRHIQPDRVGQPWPRACPQPYAVAVTPATSGADEPRAGAWIPRLAQLPPPAPQAFDGDTGGVVITAHRHPSHMLAPIIHPRGHGVAPLRIGTIRPVDGLWVARLAPGLPSMFRRPDQRLLCGSDRDDGALARSGAFHWRVERPALWVTVRRRGAFASVAVGLQAGAPFLPQTGHRGMTEGVTPLSERSSPLPCPLTGPPSGRHGSPTRPGIHQGCKRL